MILAILDKLNEQQQQQQQRLKEITIKSFALQLNFLLKIFLSTLPKMPDST